jgi:DNA-binding transcriptional LysR family regulator
MTIAKEAARWQDRIGRRMRLRDLHILATVSQCGSMAKAAAQLGMTQPSVSEAIADLEHEVGQRLLDRSPKGAQPTIYGAAIIQRSRAAFDELHQGILDVESLADPNTGELVIASADSLTAGFLPNVIEELHLDHPRLMFKVVQANNVTLEFRELRDRSVDLALLRLTQPFAAADLDVTTLFHDRLLVVVGASHRLAGSRKLELPDVAQDQWIAIPPEAVVSSFAAKTFGKKGPLAASAGILTFSYQMRFHLLATGRYVTTMSESVYRYNAQSQRLKALPIDLKVPPRPVVVVALKGRTLSPVARLFISRAQRIAEQQE